MTTISPRGQWVNHCFLFPDYSPQLFFLLLAMRKSWKHLGVKVIGYKHQRNCEVNCGSVWRLRSPVLSMLSSILMLPGKNRWVNNAEKVVNYLFQSYRASHYKDKTVLKPPGPCLNIKTVFPRYGDSHVKDMTVARPSYLYHGDPYIGETTSLCWDGPLGPVSI